jgi:DNA (cytosine-5)-methyltransferase 1
MSDLSFTDCNGLAGFMSLGFVRSGMDMVLRTGTLNFGNPVAEANRHHLGDGWTSFFSEDSNEWPVEKVDAVIGCPPCSGWSLWSGPANRGPDAKAHEHTRAFMRYAARVKPKIAVFECVQQAYSQGRAVMGQYRQMLEDLSGKEYDLYHVKHNNLQLGGFSYRMRYFWIAVEKGMPFGAHVDRPDDVPKMKDIIGDLEDLSVQWETQSYGQKTPSKWVEGLRNADGAVDGHMIKVNMEKQRIDELFEILGNDGWKPMMGMSDALRAAVEKNGDKFPQSWQSKEEKIRERDFYLGFSVGARWDAESFCHVMTGGALDQVIHPTLPRRITHREAARIQGLPDDWKFTEVKDYSPLASTWGKAVAAQAATWIGEATVCALNGQPNGPQGELIGDREWLIDTDKGFSRQFVKKTYYNKD